MVELEQILDACLQRKKELGMTYYQISDATGIGYESVFNFMRGKRSKNPHLFTAAPICAALGVSLDEFFDMGVPGTMRLRQDEKKQIIALRAVRDNPKSTPKQRLEAVKLLESKTVFVHEDELKFVNRKGV